MQYVIDKILEISSMSNDDYINVVSTFTALTNNMFNCGKCKKKYPKAPDKQKEHQARLGCDGKVNPNTVYTPEYGMVGYPKIIYNKCLGNFVDYNVVEFINFNDRFLAGQMYYPGSYSEQPAKFVEAMDLIHNLFKEHEQVVKKRMGKYGR